jgi:hypothetical protein
MNTIGKRKSSHKFPPPMRGTTKVGGGFPLILTFPTSGKGIIILIIPFA